MARILIAPTKNTSVKDKVSKLLREENHSIIDSNHEALDWSEIDPDYKKWTSQEAIGSLLGNPAVKSAYADLERDMRSADACLLFFPTSHDAAAIAGWFSAHQRDVVGLVHSQGELPVLAFMTTDLCLNIDEVVDAFSDR
ncbi:hypothetical protein ACQU0X_23995 [Pseudovibrio ascidiaceicola]|uniref:hypothetical protein n=1 Tax=Pseudovibrio ascidiaceicola TaxID=285279 RepID=UPI003D36A922